MKEYGLPCMIFSSLSNMPESFNTLTNFPVTVLLGAGEGLHSLPYRFRARRLLMLVLLFT